MLGHMQKVSHFSAQMKKNAKCQLGRFCPEPFNYSCVFHENVVNFLVPVFYGKRNSFFPFLSNSESYCSCDLFLGASGSFSSADLSQLKDGMVRVTGKVRFETKF